MKNQATDKNNAESASATAICSTAVNPHATSSSAEKVCFSCKKLFAIDSFHKDSRMPDGLMPSCKKCVGNYRQCDDCGDCWANPNWWYYCPGCKYENTSRVKVQR